MGRYIKAFLIPVLLIGAFFGVYKNQGAMTFAAYSAGKLWRQGIGALTSLLPFSLVEILAVLAVLLVLTFIILMIVFLIKRKSCAGPLRLGMIFIIIIAYMGAAFLWFWTSTYFAPPVYESVLKRRGITAQELYRAGEYFLEGANRTAPLVLRDSEGRYAEDIDQVLSQSKYVYHNIIDDFPRLSGNNVRVKKLISSKGMSILGYTGVYFCPTGEANINADPSGPFIPSAIAHEIAHSKGVGPEDAASFFGIAACITSEIPVYEYSGYLEGLMYIGNALYRENYELYTELTEGYSDYVRLDLYDDHRYWAEIEEKKAKTPIYETVTAMVTESYDGYLKASAQESGIKSYGECVDLLTVWVLDRQE